MPAALMSPQALTLLVALVMTGLVCILLGAGIPTTANYIIMATIAAPALGLLGVEPIVAHFFDYLAAKEAVHLRHCAWYVCSTHL